MATLSGVKRLARLGGWLALSIGAMVAAACGALLSSGCESSSTAAREPGVDSSIATDKDAGAAPALSDAGSSIDSAGGEANGPTDADETDLWNVICE